MQNIIDECRLEVNLQRINNKSVVAERGDLFLISMATKVARRLNPNWGIFDAKNFVLRNWQEISETL